MEQQSSNPAQRRRPHLGVHFRCCNVYAYIYKNKAGTAYTGRCPRCGQPIMVKISRDGGGSEQRIFQTS